MKGKVRRGCGGPCNHCGRTCSPCWRKGPPEKPVLCNACGARYLVKRSLEGYMPGQKTTGGGGSSPRETSGREGGRQACFDAPSCGSSDRSTEDRRTISSGSLSHSPPARPRRRRRPLNRLGDDAGADWDLMETDQAGAGAGFSYGSLGIGGRGGFQAMPMSADQERMEELAHVAACTLAMLRCSGLRLKAARDGIVRRGRVAKPLPPHRIVRIIHHG